MELLISDHLSYMRSSPFCHFPVLLTAFRLWPLFCLLFHFATFSILSVFQYHLGPKTRSHFPVHTCWAAARREREGGGKRRIMMLAHTVYKISFEHSKIWKKKHQTSSRCFECLGPTALSRKRKVWCNPPKWPIFLLKTNNQDGVNYNKARFKIIHYNRYAQELVIRHNWLYIRIELTKWRDTKRVWVMRFSWVTIKNLQRKGLREVRMR
jgi:hypothetical protein